MRAASQNRARAEPFRLRQPIRRILVLRPRALGDVLLVTPALRALRAVFPAAEIHLAVDDVLAPVVQRNPHVDRLWLFPRRMPRARLAWWRLYCGLALAGFDLVLDLHGSPRTALLAWLTRAPNRVGYELRNRGRLYTHRVPRDTDRHDVRRVLYAAQNNMEIVARLGVAGPELADTNLVLTPDPAADAAAATAVAQLRRPLVALAPAATWAAKTAPPELFARVGELLLEARCSVLVLWGPGERDVAEKVQELAHNRLTLAPPTDLDALAALLGQIDLVVSNDSGVKHLAVARGTPTLTLFGPTHPLAWMPSDSRHAYLRVQLPCLACNRRTCLHQMCMQLLDAPTIAQHALAQLHSSAQPMRRPA